MTSATIELEQTTTLRSLKDIALANVATEKEIKLDVNVVVVSKKAPAPSKVMTSELLVTTTNIICTVLGAGIVSLPFAVAGAGGWWGMLLLFAIAALQLYTGTLLFRAMARYPGVHNYGELAGFVVGPLMQRAVTVGNCIFNVGAAICFLILASTNIESMIGEATGLGNKSITVLLALVLVPLVCLRSYKDVAVLSVFGIFASLLVMVAILSNDTRVAKSSGYALPSHPVETSFELVLTSACLLMNGFAPHTILPELIHDTRGAREKTGARALAIAFAIITIVYAGVAGSTLYSYGCQLLNDALLLLPIGALYYLSTSCVTIHVTTALSIFTNACSTVVEDQMGLFTATSTFTPTTTTTSTSTTTKNPSTPTSSSSGTEHSNRSSLTEEEVGVGGSTNASNSLSSFCPSISSGQKPKLVSVCLRISLLALITTIACLIPNFGAAFSVLGSLAFLSSVVYPALFACALSPASSYKTNVAPTPAGPATSKDKCALCFNAVLVLMGVLFWVGGFTTSVMALMGDAPQGLCATI